MLLQIDVSFLTIPLELDSLKPIFDQHLIKIYQRIYNVNTQIEFWKIENENKCMINGREIERPASPVAPMNSPHSAAALLAIW